MLIREMALELKLPYLKDNYEDLINQAKHTSMNHEEFLLAMLEKEYELRKSNGVARRLRYARFPVKKYLEDFDRSKYIVELRKKFTEIETLQFIENKENIILIGTSGAGNYRKFLFMARNKGIYLI